jgi:hypothetical protein
MQVGMALTPNSLARRKSGVQIPSPPPPNQQVRASSASSGRRSLHVAAALRPRAQVPVQPGRLSGTTRLGPGPPMMTTEGSRRFQPELRVARQAGLEGHCGSGRWSSRSRDTAGRPGPGPPGRAVARRTRRAPRVTGADTADAERPDTDTGRRTSTPGHWTPNAWTSRARTLDGHTGHRTPDTGHVDTTDYADRVPRHGWHPDRHPGSPRPADCPLGRGTVDLWTAPAALGNDDRSARVGYLPARDYLPRHHAPARSLRRPGRASAHCSPPMISGQA